MDKQFVRDYLLNSSWDRNSIPPELPEDIVSKTSQRYMLAYEKITGKKFSDFQVYAKIEKHKLYKQKKFKYKKYC